MGKIKIKMIKNSGRTLIKDGLKFSPMFEKNKEILKGIIKEKKVRNRLAGYLVRLEKQRDE